MRLLERAALWFLLLAAPAATLVAVVLSLRDGDEAPVPRPEPSPTIVARTPLDVCRTLLELPSSPGERVFAPIYIQRREANGIAIVATAAVDPAALDVAAETIERMFANNDLEVPLAEAGAYVIVLADGQTPLDTAEFACLGDEGLGLADVCGVADTAGFPFVTVHELDLLGDRAGPCRGLNVLYHELGHLVQDWALADADHFEARLLYSDAIRAGLYRGEYASRNFREYFAEGTQAFFASTDVLGTRNRDWLRSYDPALYELLVRVYGEE